ncbi:MAG: oligosaccharide flippase family protein [Ruminococcus sp.]|nr:oligosaccharide flippase family protein [Ruminococcus sp.]
MNRKIGAVLSYVFMIFEVLSTLLLTPLIISSLGDAEYGVYKLIASVTGYLLLLDLGMGNSVVRYVAKYKENNDLNSNRKFVGVCVIFYSIIAVVVLALGGILIMFFQDIFAKGLSPSEIELSKQLLVLTVLNAAVTLGTSVFNNIIIAYSRFTVSKGSAIIQIIARIILTVVALELGFKSIAIVAINLLLTVIVRLYYIIYVLYVLKLRPKFKNIDFSFIKEIVAYSSFILLQMIATQINCYADQVLLGMFVVSSSVIIAVYGVGTQLVQYFQSIGQALGGILMPGVVKMVEKGATPEELQNEMVRIGRYSLSILGIIFVGFAVNGQTFLTIWVGDGYKQSYYVALLLMLAYVFILTESIGTQILWAKNKHQLQSVIKLLIVVLNVFLTIILIKWNPLIGATIGTFISLMLGDVLCMNIVFKKEIGISLKQYYCGLFKGIAPCLVLSTVSGWLFSLVNMTGLVAMAVNLVIMVSVYLISMWFFGLNSGEKKLLKSITGKLLVLRKK